MLDPKRLGRAFYITLLFAIVVSTHQSTRHFSLIACWVLWLSSTSDGVLTEGRDLRILVHCSVPMICMVPRCSMHFSWQMVMLCFLVQQMFLSDRWIVPVLSVIQRSWDMSLNELREWEIYKQEIRSAWQVENSKSFLKCGFVEASSKSEFLGV